MAGDCLSSLLVARLSIEEKFINAENRKEKC